MENKIKLIAGKINNCNSIYYWKIETYVKFKIGDYAIVENMNDYDLVKIIGVVETKEEYVKFITNCKVNKEVVKIIERQVITNEEEAD